MNKSIHAIRPLGDEINLPGGQRVVLQSDGQDSIIRVEAEGAVLVSMRITDKGAELLFEDGLQMRSQGELTLDGDKVTIRGREELRLESGGEASITVTGDLHSEARIQTIRATLGNVNLKANDDVKLRGERILLNC